MSGFQIRTNRAEEYVEFVVTDWRYKVTDWRYEVTDWRYEVTDSPSKIRGGWGR